jgi:serine/threonine protein phosphatase PrpC
MEVLTLRAAGATDPGLQRDCNEDQFHVDVSRGLFMVIDGVGGQAAGRQAADVALTMLRARLERETGPPDERVRQAIAVANNEIHRLASTRPEWNGMACVLTVALVKDGVATIGHVGDTRLYKIRRDQITKITRDHSPVGEREDSGEISESAAMRHPRRNEVYRDVGSEPHGPDDPDFVELDAVPFEADAALLLCSDGLSDLVRAATIGQIVSQFAGDPARVVRSLIDAANDAGGRDNVTVVYVEGERFGSTRARQAGAPVPAQPAAGSAGDRFTDDAGAAVAARRRRPLLRAVLAILLLLSIGLAAAGPRLVAWLSPPALRRDPVSPPVEAQVVQPGESIMAAVERATPGFQIIVEPGEYREQVVLKNNVRLLSRVPRGATIRLPAAASEAEAAVVATGLSSADFVGFRIVGDAATPLGTGLRVHDAALWIADVEIAGATKAAIEFSGEGGTLVGSEIRDNPGAAIVVRTGASPRIASSAFLRNGMGEEAPTPVAIEPGSRPLFQRNVFRGIGPEAFVELEPDAQQALARDNWFLSVPPAASPLPPARGVRRGRR